MEIGRDLSSLIFPVFPHPGVSQRVFTPFSSTDDRPAKRLWKSTRSRRRAATAAASAAAGAETIRFLFTTEMTHSYILKWWQMWWDDFFGRRTPFQVRYMSGHWAQVTKYSVKNHGHKFDEAEWCTRVNKETWSGISCRYQCRSFLRERERERSDRKLNERSRRKKVVSTNAVQSFKHGAVSWNTLSILA